ncbi:sensor histidine kinase [Flagellimonas pelagia]|nr:histidine kinase [Allomuricauda maritima]
MKKVNWGIGIPFSVILSVLGSLPILLHFSTDEVNLFLRSISYNLIITLLSWYIFHRVLESRYFNLSKGRGTYFAFCTSITIVFAFVLNFFFTSLIGFSIKPIMDSGSLRYFLLILFRGLMLGALISFVVNYLDVIREKQRNALVIEQLKQKQLEANLSSLKEQMSPHFLFNSLNSLISVIKRDSNGAVNFVIRLSEVYRYLLQHREHQTVSLKEELDFIDAYIFLLKVRFKNNIRVKVNIPEKYINTRIPPLTLQLLLENAVKHNIVSKTKPLDIEIGVDNQMIIVSNQVQPKVSLETSHGFGLGSMEEQYWLLAQKEILIKEDNNKFKVLLPLLI